ncbi:MAG: TRAP transporter permease [Marinobacter sp.]|nr:TRAP transporter permease [Marinobacter sp.]
MDFSLAPFIALALIFVLMALGVPVFAALALSGAAGIIMVEDLSFLMARLQSISYSTTAVYALTIIPLFILMGSFAQQAGVGKKLFDVARQWVGHLPGRSGHGISFDQCRLCRDIGIQRSDGGDCWLGRYSGNEKSRI